MTALCITFRAIHIFVITSCSVPLTMRHVSHKICKENQNTHLMFSNFVSTSVLFTR